MKRYNFYCSFILFFITITAISIKSQWVFYGFAPFASDQYYISVPNCSTIVIAGGTLQMPQVYLSTSGGANFVNIKGNITGGELYSVWAKNKDTIFVGDGGGPGGLGGNAKVWRTFNSGVNWNTILTTGGSLGFINGIVFERPSQKFGVVFSDPPAGTGGWYAKTFDGGVTWSVHSGTFSTQVTSSIFCADSLLFGFGMISPPPRICFTSNGGASWNTPTLSGLSGNVSSIAFSSDKLNGIAGTSAMGSSIAKTTNGGASWFLQPIGSGVSGYCNLKWIWGSSICFLSGTSSANSCVKISYNNGTNWTLMTTSTVTGITNLDANRELNGINAWGVAQDASLIKLPCGIIGASSMGSEIPESFGLFQNYPNPFNPKTNIRFAVPSIVKSATPNVKLTVYDLLGNEIAALVNEELSPGVYEVGFEGSKLASGVYYYSLSAGDFLETKKMVLIK